MINDLYLALGGVGGGAIVGGLIQNRRHQNELKKLTLELNNKQEKVIKDLELDVNAACDEGQEKESRKREKEDDNQLNRRNNQAKRRRRLTQREEDLVKNEKDLDECYRVMNRRKKNVQGQQKQNRNKRQDLYSIHDEQKAQLTESLGVELEEVTGDILKDLEEQVNHESQLWLQHYIEDIEHLNRDLAENLVDTLVCRMQLKPTVKLQENKISIPEKEDIKKAMAEGSPLIVKIQDLTHVELMFNEERTEVRTSAYDGVAREICLRLLNRLFQNWSDKEGWLENSIQQITERLEREMTRGCGDLLRRLRVENVHVEVVRTQGRLRFRTSYGQNVLDHVLEAAYIGGMMASEMGLDGKLGRRSSFLHDVGKAIDVTQEGSHPELGGEFLLKIEEMPEVCHAAAKHHGGYNPLHLFTAIAKSADAMSGGRPGARRETIDNYVERVQSLENIAQRPKGVLSVSITQAGRDIQVNVDPKKIKDEELQEISDAVAADIQKELTYPGEIKVSAVREIWTKQKTR
jgi:ribonuclease Y